MNHYIKEMNAYLAKTLPGDKKQDFPKLINELYLIFLDISGRDPAPVERCYQSL